MCLQLASNLFSRLNAFSMLPIQDLTGSIKELVNRVLGHDKNLMAFCDSSLLLHFFPNI